RRPAAPPRAPAGPRGSGGGPPPPSRAPPPPSAGRPPSLGISSRGTAPERQTVDAEEILRMQRRIDQLASELRLMRGGGDRATRMEELEDRITRLEKENRAIEEVANEY